MSESSQQSREFDVFFHSKVNIRANGFLQTLSLIASFLFPLFGVLDWVLYPDNYQQLIIIRLCVLPIILLVFVLSFKRDAPRYVKWSGTLLYQSMGLAISLMVLFTGGEESRYYSGVELVLLAMFIYMPWKPRYSIINSLAIYLIYLLILITNKPLDNIEWRLVVSNSYFILSTIFLGSIWSVLGYRLLYRETVASRKLANEKSRSDKLLLNILPVSIARELTETQQVKPVLHPNISVLFTDFVGFTKVSADIKPEALLQDLDRSFIEFDRIVKRYGLEKLKTIGDAFMCAAGIPTPKKTHAVDCVMAALDMLDIHKRIMNKKAENSEHFWDIRLGVHTGPAIAGITGSDKFAYDIWGDTVNTASRTESSAAPGTIAITEATHQLVKKFFDCESVGPVSMKGKGVMKLYRVIGYKSEYFDEESGQPNTQFFRLYRRMLVYGY